MVGVYQPWKHYVVGAANLFVGWMRGFEGPIVTNLFDQLNSIIVNPVTGKAYPDVDSETTNFEALRNNPDYDVTTGTRDPRFEDPTTSGLPPFNPARFLPQRHVVLGLSYRF